MEVLDNGNHLKEASNQASGTNYSCRLPRDLNIVNSVSQNKTEADIRLLLACKAQLSSEVIKWKTESLRLQKERDSARIRVKELDGLINKYSEKVKDLESHLLAVEEENKKLRIKHLNPDNLGFIHKLSLDLEKYHSYPWLENGTKVSNCTVSSDNYVDSRKNQELVQEDWKEVSQKLLEKMKQEMKELQELSVQFSLSEKQNCGIDYADDDKSLDASSYLEHCLSNLSAETQSLKHSLLEQRKSLQSLFGLISRGRTSSSLEASHSSLKSLHLEEIDVENEEIEKLKNPLGHSYRHSDDSFQAFFTKHLDHQNPGIQKSKQSDSGNSQASCKSISATTSRTSKFHTDKSKENSSKIEERVCPICELPFNMQVPQKDFEEHVLKHLEVESASLLDQYVIL